ncbi:MAG TPA: DUF1343 domain-containing protein [Candidatus Krumholzibacteria bacterium]|nr:DUF1343 domain-containing protein [Candidatus Krumholzibacteria bacterium]
MPQVRTGLDRLLHEGHPLLTGRRAGLLCHPASVDARLRHAAALLHADPRWELRAFFGPQHGIRGETQDNMIEWEGFRDPATGLPVHSLYGAHRKPTQEMLRGLDVLVVDLQDVGARYYTFIWTVLLCLEACAEAQVDVLVLDRPNPLGDAREGNVGDPAYRSFVGLAPVPMRHGLTVGQMARWCVAHFRLDVELAVLGARGGRPSDTHPATGLPWVLPSPNMPTWDTALVYPGMCLLEGTSASEGRGTTRPFEIFGLPGLDSDALVARLAGRGLPGVVFRPLHFQPTFQKHAGALCGGAQIHVTDAASFRPVRTAVEILAALLALAPETFAWNPPPYEYETEKLPIDILAGGPELREALAAGADPAELCAAWDEQAADFARDLDPAVFADD